MSAYYNEIDPYAAQWLRNLIAHGHIADGEVDERSISDVREDEIRGFTQCHFFAGIGAWSYAARLAGWPDEKQLWTGSCPCQPFSRNGKKNGLNDERHLWPEFHRLINAVKPNAVAGEQVAGADGLAWLDGVQDDLEASNYAVWAANLAAGGFGAPHKRERIYFMADAKGGRRQGENIPAKRRLPPYRIAQDHWGDFVSVRDGAKSRRSKPGINLLANGSAYHVGRLRAYGNAIIPQIAAHVLSAYMST